MEKKGTYIDEKGYLRDTYGKLIHRRIASQKFSENDLSHFYHFEDCIVHHINSNKLDNDEDNLYICLQEDHNKIHEYQKKNKIFETKEEIDIFLKKEPKKDWREMEKNIVRKVGRGRVPSLEKEREREKYNFPYEVPKSVKIEHWEEKDNKKKSASRKRKKSKDKSERIIHEERQKNIERNSEILREIKRRRKLESITGSMKISFWILYLVTLLFWAFGTPFLISLLVGLLGFLIALIISIIK